MMVVSVEETVALLLAWLSVTARTGICWVTRRDQLHACWWAVLDPVNQVPVSFQCSWGVGLFFSSHRPAALALLAIHTSPKHHILRLTTITILASFPLPLLSLALSREGGERKGGKSTSVCVRPDILSVIQQEVAIGRETEEYITYKQTANIGLFKILLLGGFFKNKYRKEFIETYFCPRTVLKCSIKQSFTFFFISQRNLKCNKNCAFLMCD